MRAVLGLLLVLIASDAEARSPRYYYRKKPPVEQVVSTVPALPSARVIPLFCKDDATTFDEVWCHRFLRPMTKPNTFTTQ